MQENQSLHHTQKYRYDTRFADRKYRELLSSSRAGSNITKQELNQKTNSVVHLGKSSYQILANHPELDMSVYTHVFLSRSGRIFCTKYRPQTKSEVQVAKRYILPEFMADLYL